jgi:hypothetical protein
MEYWVDKETNTPLLQYNHFTQEAEPWHER